MSKKQLTDREIQGIEYAMASCAMETGVSKEHMDRSRLELTKVALGEITEEEYRTMVIERARKESPWAFKDLQNQAKAKLG